MCVCMYVCTYICICACVYGYVLIPIFIYIALKYTSDFSIWESESSMTFCNRYNGFMHQVLASILIKSGLSKSL